MVKIYIEKEEEDRKVNTCWFRFSVVCTKHKKQGSHYGVKQYDTDDNFYCIIVL